jgi:hypothetical protein
LSFWAILDAVEVDELPSDAGCMGLLNVEGATDGALARTGA